MLPLPTFTSKCFVDKLVIFGYWLILDVCGNLTNQENLSWSWQKYNTFNIMWWDRLILLLSFLNLSRRLIYINHSKLSRRMLLVLVTRSKIDTECFTKEVLGIKLSDPQKNYNQQLGLAPRCLWCREDPGTVNIQ